MKLPKATKKAKTESEMKAWQAGFEAGSRTMFNSNEIAIDIGNAILTALDRRYERQKEDY